MKILITFITTIFMTYTFANSRVGDRAAHLIEVQGLNCLNISEYSSFSDSEGIMIRTDALTCDRRTSVSSGPVKEADLITPELVDSIILNCAQIGGSLETVVIPLGSFVTCKINLQALSILELDLNLLDSQGTGWVGRVPVNPFVKLKSGNTIMTLDSYSWAN